MASALTLKDLKIKTGSVKRLLKEASYYKKELGESEERLQQMRDAGLEAAELKQAENVVGESRAMIPESAARLESAVADLQAFVEDNAAEIAGTPELAAAQEQLDAAAAAAP